MRSRLRGIAFRAAAALLGVVGMLVLIELVGRLYFQVSPSYEVLFLEPDRIVGWKLAPRHSFTWTGVHWDAPDFSVDVRTNSLGFRDEERSVQKQEGVVRIALLGDSFIEALQVPFDETAGQVLQADLDRRAAATGSVTRYEVLNFGVSSHGLGQALLVWEAYARSFRPDYVFVFVSELLLRRSVQPVEAGAFPSSRSRHLAVRPTFRFEDGKLIRVPARDFDVFVRAQQDLIRSRFGGGGSRSRERSRSLLFHLLQSLPTIPRLGGASAPPKVRSARRPRMSRPPPSQPQDLLEVNLAILEELGRSVRATGAELVLVDASETFASGMRGLHKELVALCQRAGFGYVPAYRAFAHAQGSGQTLRWAHDPHLNQMGNQVLGRALAHWMAKRTGLVAGETPT